MEIEQKFNQLSLEEYFFCTAKTKVGKQKIR
jgi:hypothetical protein